MEAAKMKEKQNYKTTNNQMSLVQCVNDKLVSILLVVAFSSPFSLKNCIYYKHIYMIQSANVYVAL